MESPIIVTTPEQIENIVLVALKKHEAQKEKEHATMKLLTINQVRLALGVGHSSVQKLIKKGLLKATEDNKILQSELDRYLQNK